MSAPDLAAVAAELFALRTLVEAEERTTAMLAEVAGASWVALYRSSASGYELRCDAGPLVPDLPAELDSDPVLASLADGAALQALESDPEGLPGAALRAGFRSEFLAQPVLLLIGPALSGGYTAADLESLESLSELCSAALRNAELVEKLRSQVFIDFLTGCYNRRAFDEHLAVEVVRARRYERPLTLLLMDLDEFKQLNDDLGHPAGDEALRQVGEALRGAFRTTDRVCRYGGDEFAVIFPETSKDDVLRLAERLRRQVASIFSAGGERTGVTASIGVAAFPIDGIRADDVVRAADRALYSAKSAGRNRVVAA